MRIGPFGYDDDEDPDRFTEAYDCRVDRVDLVAKAASGRSFILMKSAQDGPLVAAADVRKLLAKSTPTPESTMAVPKMIKYTRGGHTVTSARQLTKGQLADAIVKAKAKQSAQVAVFDSAGNLVGTVDADAITPLAPAVDPAPPKTPAAPAAPKPAPIVQPDATDGPVAAAAEDIKKALQGVRWPGVSVVT
jgi:hypothetical protein